MHRLWGYVDTKMKFEKDRCRNTSFQKMFHFMINRKWSMDELNISVKYIFSAFCIKCQIFYSNSTRYFFKTVIFWVLYIYIYIYIYIHIYIQFRIMIIDKYFVIHILHQNNIVRQRILNLSKQIYFWCDPKTLIIFYKIFLFTVTYNFRKTMLDIRDFSGQEIYVTHFRY